MDTFPGGTLSSDKLIGVTHIAGNRLIAIDLTSGQLLWAIESEGRPVAATDRYVIILDFAQQSALAIRDLRSGMPVLRAGANILSDAAADLADRYEALSVSARDINGGVELTWRIEPRYTGGAAPRQSANPKSALAGQTAIDLTTGKITNTTYQSFDPINMPSDSPIGPHARDGASELPGEKIRDLTRPYEYVLRVEPKSDGRKVVILDAFRSKDRHKMWETELGEIDPLNNPQPLRK